jgi:hypothetical protein
MELTANQPHNCGVIGEDAAHIRPALDFLVQPLERVGAPELAPVLLREVEERQHVVSGSFHHGHGTEELLSQHLGEALPVGALLVRCLDHTHHL